MFHKLHADIITLKLIRNNNEIGHQDSNDDMGISIFIALCSMYWLAVSFNFQYYSFLVLQMV